MIIEVTDMKEEFLRYFDTQRDVIFENSIVIVSKERKLPLPKNFDVGLDLYAEVYDNTISPQSFCILPTNIKVMCPVGFHFEVRPRSSLPIKHSLLIANSPGTIDPSYRGEVGIIVFNPTNKNIIIEKPTRLAQLCLVPYIPYEQCQISYKSLKIFVFSDKKIYEEFDTIFPSNRGSGGFGSSGHF